MSALFLRESYSRPKQSHFNKVLNSNDAETPCSDVEKDSGLGMNVLQTYSIYKP